MGKIKTTEVPPYATTLLINARACRTDVPLLPVERVDVTTTGALVKVTVDVKVLREVDEDVVLEPFEDEEEERPGKAVATTVGSGADEALMDEDRERDEAKASKVLDVVALTGVEGGKLGDVVLLDSGIEVTLLDVILMKPTGKDDKNVMMLVEFVFCGMGKLVNGPEEPTGVAVIVDTDEDEMVELGALSEPIGVRMAVVEGVTTGDVLTNELVELIVKLNPNEGRAGWVPVVDVKLLTDTEKPDVVAGGLRVEVGAKLGETVSDEVPPEDAGVDSEA